MSISSGSTKPYLIRALYDWCVDNQQTPYLAVWVDEQTRVPMQYVRDNEIVLSISPTACQNLKIDNDWVHFTARFGGVSHEIWIPVGNVISIFAKETGEGMGFEIEKIKIEQEEFTGFVETNNDHEQTIEPEDAQHPHLRVLK